jgi:hypothetical protein
MKATIWCGVAAAMLLLSENADAQFSITNNSPPLTILPYEASFTYSITWSNSTYYNAQSQLVPGLLLNVNTGVGFFFSSTFGHGFNFTYPSPFPSTYTFSYTIAGVDANNDGYYYLDFYEASVNNYIKTPLVYLHVSPAILVEPQSAVCIAGVPTTLGLVAGPTNSTFQWFNAATGGTITGQQSLPEFIPSLSEDGDDVFCTISNPYGQVTSTNVQLAVKATPSISSKPSGVTASFGGSAAFVVTANGTQPLDYQWYKNGTLVTNATLNAITIGYIGSGDLGAYQVVITNSYGSVTSTPALLSATVPSITMQPTNLNVGSGGAASFNVAATGTQPLYYQWFKNGVAIQGANLNYIIFNPASYIDSGLYEVTVSNLIGYTTSTSSVLNVISGQLPLGIASLNKQVAVDWVGESNITYQIQWSEDLETWSPFTNVIGDGSLTNITDNTANSNRFYRLIQQ